LNVKIMADFSSTSGQGFATAHRWKFLPAALTGLRFTLLRLGLLVAVVLTLSASAQAATLTVATGGNALSADAVGGAYTTLVGPTYNEAASGEAGLGTIILNAPAGFVFDTGGTAPTVVITRLAGSGTNANNINNVASGTAAAVTSRTTNQITFTVSDVSAAGVTCALTWQDVRVRPTAGAPLASGTLTCSGTAPLATVTAGSTSFGTLTEVAGAANHFAFTTQPALATAGAPFGVQPVVRARDQFGNDSSTGLPASLFVSMVLSSGSGTLLGTTNEDIGTAAGNGLATFTDLRIDKTQTTKQLTASAAGFTSAASSYFTVLPGAASVLVLQTQPSATATAGVAFAQQPVLTIYDAYSNVCGLASTPITATRNAGTGTLQGTTTVTPVNGTVTFTSLAHTTATTLTIDFTGTGLNTVTSSAVVVSPAAASRLTIQTQPSGTAIVGAPFAQQPVIRIEDAFGNLRSGDNTTAVTATRSAGSGTLQGTTNRTAVNGVVTFTDLSHNVVTNITLLFAGGSLSNATSTPIAVGPAAVDHLVFTVQPASATAGSNFGLQPVLKTRDAFGNDSVAGLPASLNVTLTLTSGTGPLQGTATQDIGTAAGNGTINFANLRIDAAGTNKQLTASASGLTGAASTVFSVSPAAAALLVIQTQPSLTATAGVAFATQPVLRIEDGFGNRITTDNSTVVTATRNAGTAALQGTTSATAVNGVATFANLSYNKVETITLNFGSGSLTGATSTSVNVVAGPPTRLVMQTQPSATAVAGIPFAQQPAVRVEDGGGNLIATDNGRVIIVGLNSGTGTLQGPLTATTVNGVATFTGLNHTVATTLTLGFTASGVTAATSGNIVVGPGAASQLGFATQPGGALAGSLLATQPVVAAQDQFGNTSTIGLPASLPLSLALTSGSGNLLGTTTLDLGTAAGNGVAAFTDLQCTTVGTNKQLTATAVGFAPITSSVFNAGGLVLATGGSALSADSVGGAYTTLVGPTYYEAASGDIGTGTIILNPPAGFVFDTGGTAPTVVITRLAGSGSNTNNLNNVASGTAAAITSRTANQITFTVSDASIAGVTCGLTWQDIRVRPSAGSPLASGNLTRSGTAAMAAVTAGSTSFGSLTEVVGTANRLAFTTQPGAATAGAPFGIQPVVRTRDQFGNDSITGLPASKLVTLTLSSGTGTLQGTTSADIGTAAGNGQVTFTDLRIDQAQASKQLTASASSFTNAVSSGFAVLPAAASQVIVQTQPSPTATAGLAFAPQPAIAIADSFGNVCSSDNSTVVSAARNVGTAALQGTLSATAVNGVATFANLSYNKAESLTINFTAAGLGSATSSAVAVSPGAASRLTILTQPSPTASAGAPFAQQPVLRIEDQFGNLRSSDNATAVTASRSAGSGTLQGTTTRTAINGVVTFTDLAHNVVTNITVLFASGSLSNATSTPIAIGPAAADRLVFSVQPANATAGSSFGVQPALKTRDAFGNDSVVGLPASLNVTLALTSGTGPLQGVVTQDIGTAAGNGTVNFANLRIDAAGTNKQLTASASGLTAGLSSVFSVNPAAAASVVVQTQPSLTATAGVAFASQPVLRLEDPFGNRVTTDNSTVVTATRNAGTAALQGTTGVTAVNGLATFANLSYNKAETISLNFSSGSLTGATSTSVSVVAGAAGRLVMQTQPSQTAAAGVPFAQQPAVRVEDQFGNFRSADNSTVVTAALIAGSGTLQGTTTATAVNGIASFSNLAHNVVTTLALGFSASGATGTNSTPVTVGPGPFAGLQLLVPGESAAPGSGAGKTGTPSPQIVGTSFTVIVNAVDAFWNRVPVSDAVALTSSDTVATLPPATALAGGTSTLSVFLNTVGSFTVTASDVTDGSKAANTSLAITVGAGQFTRATGGEAMPADGAGGSFTTLTNLTYSENNAGEVGTGTMILNAPAGFVFDTGGASPNVSSVKISGSGNTPVAGSVTAVTTNQITYTVTAKSLNPSLLTWQNVRVRPVSGTPLASGYLRMTGTATTPGLSTNSNVGNLSEVAGAAAALVLLQQPSALATAGIPFAQQPVLEVRDQFGNVRSVANGVPAGTTLVTAARLAGSGTLQGSTTQMAAADGSITFTNLSHNTAGTITVQFTSGSATATSSPITVSAGAAAQLAFATQPGNATVGAAFGTQPVLKSRDAFGNDSTLGLPASLIVSVSLTAGTGPLQGTTSFDLGTAAGNGTVACTDLRLDAAGTNKQLTASATGLASALSSVFAVNPGPAAQLVIQTQPPGTATAGVTFAPAPVLRLLDAFGNPVTTDSSTVVTATRNAGTTALQGTTSVTAVNGVATFANLSYRTAETITMNFSAGSLTPATSTSVTVNPAPASRLALLTQPSPTTTAGVPFAQQPAVRVEDAFGNLRSADNSTVVTAARSAGSGTLQGTTTATAVNGIASFSDLAHNVATNITLGFSASGLTGTNSATIAVAPAAFAKLQVLLPGETAAPGSASGSTGTPTAQTAGSAVNATVNAVDAFWNRVGSVTDTVSTACSDANATLPANTDLVAGTMTLSVTFKTAGSQTLTASDADDATKTADISSLVTINAGAFAKLQLLAPGETAAPGTATGKTGTPSAQTAGTTFNLTVNAVDTNWNVVSSTHTIAVSSTDPNDTQPANAAMVAGTRTFALTFKTAGAWTATASDVTDGTKNASTTPPITATTGAFAKLQLLLPGETAAPGTATGKTGTPSAQTAGTTFNVTANAVDANWNLISTATDTVGLASSDSNALLPANVALTSGTASLAVTLKTAGSRTLTASDATDGTKTANTSPALTVSAGAFTKLQLLVPGETAAPGTGSGKSGTPSAQAAGTAFSVTINAVDAYWNLVSSIHTVGLTASDTNATLPSNGALASGSRTVSVTLRTPGSQVLTATDITDGTKTSNVSSALLVNAGPASRLVVKVQPSATAIAGVPFAQQPAVRVEDASGNLLTTDNGRVITAAINTGTGTLQGTLTATTLNGVATFANLNHTVATNITLRFTASGLTNATSSSIAVAPNTAMQLTFTTQPGGSRTGSPLTNQPVVVAQDAYGNASAVGLPPSLMLSLALTSGSGSLLGTTALDIGTAARNGTGTFTNVECSAAGTNKQLTAFAPGLTNEVSAAFFLGGVEPTTSGAAIPSSTAGGTWTTLTGPAYYEFASGDAGTGTIYLNAPAGFEFDTSGTAPTVRIDRLAGSGLDSRNINGVATGTAAAISQRTTNQIRFSVTTASSSGVTCSLTWQNIRVRPTAASPLASGNITRAGTAVMAAVTTATSFGQLIEVGGAARLTIQTQPSATATAGVPFAQQPVLRIEDAAGNLVLNNTNSVTVTRSGGSGTLQGTTVRTATNGLVMFTDLAHSIATNITLSFSSPGLTGATSTVIAVSKASQSLTLGALAGRTYGDGPFPLTASASSGLPVSFSVVSGPAVVSGNTLGLTGAGTVTVRASQAGDDTWLAAASVDQVFTVARAVLTVSADNQSRVYGAPNPTLTAHYSGFVNGDDASVLSGSPQFSTTALQGSSVAGSPYAITPSQGALAAANYNFVFVAGQLSIVPASSQALVSSSANPAVTGSNVTFTTTLCGVAPCTSVPPGQVQFLADGAPLGAPVALNSGAASLTVSSLAHGLHTITAQYAGDANFSACSNALAASQVINTPPVAALATYTRTTNTWLQIPITDLMTNYTSDADGDALTLVSVGAGTNNATVLISGGSIYYLPSDTDPNRNAADQLDYVISDNYAGGTVTNQIRIQTDIAAKAVPAMLTRLSLGTNGVLLTFTGSPTATYQVQRTTNLAAGPSGWLQVGSATTDSNGAAQFTDSNPPAGQGFYRLLAP
jgi:hypothetical protein